MKTIEINEIGKYIDASPVEMNLMFIGDTGIGKTTEIERYCKKKGIYLKTLILSQLDASEALGIPVRVTKNYNGEEISVLDTAIPVWVLELAEHKNAILFLDEFLCAPPSVMNSFLNFLTQKKVKNIDLSHVKIISATNIGHYTYDPDNNILSRFCMFYTVNTTASDFVKDKRINYSYEDINLKEGTLFDVRSLKPRCYYQLSLVKDNTLYYDFYEGFTNSEYVMIHPEKAVNDIFKQYIEKRSSKKEFYISDENIKCLVAVLRTKFSSIRNWNPFLNKLINLEPDTTIKLREALSPNVAKKVKGSENNSEEVATSKIIKSA